LLWQRTPGKPLKLAGIEGGHAHKVRHTFAVSLLLKGVPIEGVSLLSGYDDPGVALKYVPPSVPDQANAHSCVTLTKANAKARINIDHF
jgi:hypothetical protein